MQKSEPSSEESEESSSETLSVHIVDDLNVAPGVDQQSSDVKNQVFQGAASGFDSTDEEQQSLQSDILKLCYEIENANGTKANADDDNSSIDLSYHEDKLLRNIMDKVWKNKKLRLMMTTS